MRAVLSHGDIDGIVSAALVVGSGGFFKLSSTTALPEMLGQIVEEALYRGAEELVVADLNPSGPGVVEPVRRALESGVKVAWIDHHVWDPDVAEALESVGARLVLDRGKVSADLVSKYLGEAGARLPGCAERLVELAYDDDFFLNRYELTARWRRLLYWYGWGLRRRAVISLSRCRIWPGWAEEAYNRMMREYSALLSTATSNPRRLREEGFEVVVVEAPKGVHPGDIQLELSRRGHTWDLLVLRYPDHTSIRAGNGLDASAIASRLGGGGHREAAGIPGRRSIEEIMRILREYIEGRERPGHAPP